MIFTTQTMQEVLPILQTQLQAQEKISFAVLNPDLGKGYAGERIEIEGKMYLYRGYKAWVDLAEFLKCKMRTPKEDVYPLVRLSFEKLALDDSFHTRSVETKLEKYGTDSAYFEIQKMEEPAFLYYYLQALDNVAIATRKKILNLGINTGDEFEVIKNTVQADEYAQMHFVGIDHSASAIRYATERFANDKMRFIQEDINQIDSLKLDKCDLLISIGTLQSPSINFKPFFMHLVQTYLEDDAAIILGFPNSRWIGGEMLYGAKVPNYAMSEMGLLYSDVMFVKKYLQQKKYRVTLTGKYYVFLTATKIKGE